MLLAKAAMLDEYFRIGLEPATAVAAAGAGGGEKEGEEEEECGYLTSLPDLLANYTPSPEAVPLFLLRLATEVGVWVCLG